jgi:hypothetical protein
MMEEIESRRVLLGVMMEATDSGACPSDLLLTKGGEKSGALGRHVSALASRNALWRVVSMMNFEDVNCDLGSN